MGHSLSAEIFFGFPLDEEKDSKFFEKNDDGDMAVDWEDLYAAAKGIPYPTVEYSEANKPIYNEYYKKKHELLKNCSCEIDWYADLDWDETYLCVKVKDFSIVAYGGELTEVEHDSVIASGQAYMDIEDFCEIMEIEYRQPKWYLTAVRS